MSDKLIWSDEDYYSDKGLSLFDIFSEYYAIKDIRICFKDNTEFLLKKYNVIGWDIENSEFNVYDDPSINNKIYSFDFNFVDKLIIN